MSAAARWDEFRDLPDLLTPEEVRKLLNLKTITAVYRRKDRGAIPGVVQISKKRWRCRKAVLLRSLLQGPAPSND